MSTRRLLWIFIAICALAALLRVLVITRSGLWADEIFSLAIATGHSLEHPAAAANPSLGDFVEPDRPVSAEELRRYLKHESPAASPARVTRAVLLSDTSPPLYYLSLYVWTLVFGTSDIALRLFSTACSLACLPLLVAVARRTGGAAAVIPACVLFAVSPLAIYYSTEGRMYSLLWLCVLGVALVSLVLAEKGGSLLLYTVWVATSVAGFLTHYFFIFPWAAIVFSLVIRPGRLRWNQLVWLLLLIPLLLLPWYVRLSESLHSWRVTQGWLNWRPGHFSRLTAALELGLQFFSGSNKQLWSSYGAAKLFVLIIFCVVAFFMLWRLRGRLLDSPRLLLVLPFVAACAGPLFFDLLQHTYTAAVPRYAIAGLPFAYLLAAVGLACFQSRARSIILILIALAWAPNVFSMYRNRSRSGSPIREIAQIASADRAPSDLILVHSIPSGVLGVARYVDGPAMLASWVGQLKTRRVPDSIHALTSGCARILLVKVHEVGEPAPEEDWLRAHAELIQQRRLEMTKLMEFVPQGAEVF